MGRPIYNYELGDPDFSWLISSFKENNPDYTFVEANSLPLLFISAKQSVEIKEVETTSEEFEVLPKVDDKKSTNIGENK